MLIHLIYKSLRKISTHLLYPLERIYCAYLFKGNNVQYQSYRTSGIPYVMVAIGGKFTCGKNLYMNNGIKGNPIGCYERCTFFVDKGAELIIGDNVGISQSAIICHLSITIGNNVKIGGGTSIYDTDFHSLSPHIRRSKEDLKKKKKAPVKIGDNVLIGAHSIILKGVVVGENAIIGAGSIVTKSVPANQIWAGNPAQFIKRRQE